MHRKSLIEKDYEKQMVRTWKWDLKAMTIDLGIYMSQSVGTSYEDLVKLHQASSFYPKLKYPLFWLIINKQKTSDVVMNLDEFNISNKALFTLTLM